VRKQDIAVEDLIGMVTRQELQLPEIQRQYVWRSPKVRDLLDSLYRGYPSGTVLVWETDDPVPTRKLAVEQGRTPFEGQKLLLDGQQRLTSLAAVMSGKPVKVRNRKNPIDILFNLEHPEGPPSEITEVDDDDQLLAGDDGADPDDGGDDTDDDQDQKDWLEKLNRRTFVVANKAIAALPNWVPVTKVFGDTSDAEVLKGAGVKGFDDLRYEKYVSRLTKLRQVKKYMYVMHVLPRDLSYEEVAEIFVRVNSLGVKLRSSDLALAQISAKWRDYLKEVEEFQEECEKKWFTLDTGLLVRTMVVFATKQSRFQRSGTIPTDELKAAWEKAKKGLSYAINFLVSNAGIEDETLLSAPTLIVPIAVYSQLKGEKLTDKESRDLLYWLLVANARGRYSRGSSESLLNEDLTILFKGGSPEDLLEPIRRLFGRLDVSAEDLIGRNARHPLFSMAYLALRARGAQDWETGVGISLDAVGKQHVIQWHHIYPKAMLKEAGIEQRTINEIANLAFISGRTNQRIGRKPPKEYFKEIVKRRGAAALEAQLIPADPDTLTQERFEEFLGARRVALAEAINDHLERTRRTIR
jgi:hypothetical protein